MSKELLSKAQEVAAAAPRDATIKLRLWLRKILSSFISLNEYNSASTRDTWAWRSGVWIERKDPLPSEPPPDDDRSVVDQLRRHVQSDEKSPRQVAI